MLDAVGGVLVRFLWLPPVRGIHLPFKGGLPIIHAWPA